MKSTLGAIGLGALLCVPCLLVIVGGAGVVSGGVLVAFIDNALVQGLGVLIVLVSAAVGARYLLRRDQGCQQCELDQAQGLERVSHHESHA
jgi:membrane protein implicated in regulation of membrane protease activity